MCAEKLKDGQIFGEIRRFVRISVTQMSIKTAKNIANAIHAAPARRKSNEVTKTNAAAPNEKYRAAQYDAIPQMPHFIPLRTVAARRRSIGNPARRITAAAVSSDRKMHTYAEKAEIAVNKTADAAKNDNVNLPELLLSFF